MPLRSHHHQQQQSQQSLLQETEKIAKVINQKVGEVKESIENYVTDDFLTLSKDEKRRIYNKQEEELKLYLTAARYKDLAQSFSKLFIPKVEDSK